MLFGKKKADYLKAIDDANEWRREAAIATEALNARREGTVTVDIGSYYKVPPANCATCFPCPGVRVVTYRAAYVESNQQVAKLKAEIAALKKAAEPKEGSAAFKTVGTKSDGYFTVNIAPQTSGWLGESDSVTVKRADHYIPAARNTFADLYGFGRGYSANGQTYKDAFTKSSARVAELESFLDDLLIVDPRLNRFDAAEFSKKGKRRTPFKWNVAAVHDAANLIRSDKAEAERRDALREMQEGGE